MLNTPLFSVRWTLKLPTEAIKTGASYLVIGRPITQAKNPMQALEDIEAEL